MNTVLCVGTAEHVRSAAGVLADAGLDAAVVRDGERARRRVAEESVDCVVTALSLPEESGLQLGRSVAVPTVVCAADGDERVAGRALAAGCDGYVPAEHLEGLLVPQVRSVAESGARGDGNADGAVDAGADARCGTAVGDVDLDAGKNLDADTDVDAGIDVDDTADGGEAGDRTVRERGDGAGASAAARTARGPAFDVEEPPGTGAVSRAAVESFVDDALRPLASGDHGEGSVPAQVRRAQTLDALHWVSAEVLDAPSREAVAERTATAAARVLDVDLAAVYLAGPGSESLQPLGAHGVPLEELPVPDASFDAAASQADGPAEEPARRDDRLRVPAADAFPVASVAAFPVGERGVLCVGLDDGGRVDAWTGKLAGLLGASADAALDRVQRRRRLRRAEAVVHAVDDCVVTLDEDGCVADVDDAVVVLTGVDRDDLVGAPLERIVDDDSARVAREALRTLGDGGAGSRRTVSVDLRTRHGDATPCELTLAAVADADGRAVGVLRDVSDRERTADRLADCEAAVSRLHDAALGLAGVRDVQAVRDVAVEAAADVLDADRCWLVERSDGGFVPVGADPDDAEPAATPHSVRRLAAIALDSGRTEVDGHLGPDRDVVDVRGGPDDPVAEYRSGIAVPVDESTVLQAVARPPAAFDDVAVDLAEVLVAHVAAALERIDYETDLRRERDRIAALFDNVPNPVVRTRIEDGSAIVEAVNPSFERVFGYETEEIVGEELDDHIVPRDRVDRAHELTRRGLEGEIVETEVQRLSATGTRDFLLTVVPIADDDGPAVNYAVYTDITERKQRQQRLEVLNRVLRHDLRNGMNVVRGSAELLAEGVDGDAQSHVAAIENRAAEMIDLADKTRTIQRILESDPGDVGPVDVVEAVDEAIDRLDVAGPDVEIETSTPYRAKARVGTLLPLAIRHVLENAVVHHDGSPTVEVEVRERRADRTVEVVVADDGPGIPEHERVLVTEQREITQLRHGSGLGLWIVNWVVTGCGGDLEIEREEPRGTVVRMALPQADADRSNLPVLLD